MRNTPKIYPDLNSNFYYEFENYCSSIALGASAPYIESALPVIPSAPVYDADQVALDNLGSQMRQERKDALLAKKLQQQEDAKLAKKLDREEKAANLAKLIAVQEKYYSGPNTCVSSKDHNKSSTILSNVLSTMLIAGTAVLILPCTLVANAILVTSVVSIAAAFSYLDNKFEKDLDNMSVAANR